jgi:cell division cycle protein 20 (cofactor of APC complex)
MDATDFENMISLDAPIKTSVVPRWERRAARQQAALTSSVLSSASDANINGSVSQCDRYIPSRSGTDWDSFQSSVSSSCSDENASEKNNNNSNCSDNEYNKLLSANIGCGNVTGGEDLSSSRVLSYKQKAPQPKEEYTNSLKVLYSAAGSSTTVKKDNAVKTMRHIPSAPIRVLDAPDLMDDYCKLSFFFAFSPYFSAFSSLDLNLLSWSSTNYLAVALSKTLYLWNAATGDIKELMNVENEGENNYISSVSFIPGSGSHIAVGTANNVVQLWDVSAGKQLRSLRGHSSRVGALSWNNHVLSSGSKDNSILHHDVRIASNVIGRMTHHSQEICGLSWSPDGSYLASGANDNMLMLQEASNMTNMNITPKHILSDHQAAVKALAWSPHERNLLASGGGTADRCIKFWNASTGSCVNSIDTGSQVCSLQWSPMEKELLSR